ncbi:MAG: hypothetical protein NTW55_02170 [Planctomycetota bacterium]|nr:hypothetical protein [Planctomycetota bacterium]
MKILKVKEQMTAKKEMGLFEAYEKFMKVLAEAGGLLGVIGTKIKTA